MRKLILLTVALLFSFLISNYTKVGASNLPEKPTSSSTITHKHNVEQKVKPNRKSIKKKSYGAEKGLIARKSNLFIKRSYGPRNSGDKTKYVFLHGEDRSTVNPNFGEHALNIGLYQVTENIYQVRGFDIANITFIKGKTGYIVIDPLTDEETARAALEFIYEQLGEEPVTAIIFTHSHADDYGGIYGVLNDDNPTIYAPIGFMDKVINEDLYAGTVIMSHYRYGMLSTNSYIDQVEGVFDKTVNVGNIELKAPDILIEQSMEKLIVDGVDMVFQLINDDDAPSEMNIYIPSEDALCIAENCTATLHNLYTVRGSKMYEQKEYSYYRDKRVNVFGEEVQNIFSSHNWTMFTADEVLYDINESTPWGNEYLSDDYESSDSFEAWLLEETRINVLDSLNIQQLIGIIAFRLENTKVIENIIFNIKITDEKLKCAVQLTNGVLVYLGDYSTEAKFTVEMPRNSLYILATGVKEELEYKINNDADKIIFENILTRLKPVERDVNIVTP